MKKIFIFLLFSILTQGCSTELELQEIVGTYYWENNEYKHSLELKNSWLYIHECKTVDGKEVNKNEGSWEILNQETTQRLSFDGFDFSYTEKRGLKKGIWAPIVETYFGDVILCFDPDVRPKKGCFIKD